MTDGDRAGWWSSRVAGQILFTAENEVPIFRVAAR